jgi:hypothetical protein
MLESILNEGQARDRSWMKSNLVLDDLNRYRSKLKKNLLASAEHQTSSYTKSERLEVLSRGFKAIIDELEQSLWAARHFASRLSSPYEEDMSSSELKDFHRFIYFQKNTYIRIFSALDKLGYFLNEHLSLQVERKKHRFSYYTVLRFMHNQKAEQELFEKLTKIRDHYELTMRDLRKRRNTEIHLIDPYLLEEMIQQRKSRSSSDNYRLPDMNGEVELLTKGYEMVCESMEKVFERL